MFFSLLYGSSIAGLRHFTSLFPIPHGVPSAPRHRGSEIKEEVYTSPKVRVDKTYSNVPYRWTMPSPTCRNSAMLDGASVEEQRQPETEIVKMCYPFRSPHHAPNIRPSE